MTSVDQRERLRQAFLADAIEVLNRSLDYQQTLAALAWVVVPTIADWCAVDTLEDGQLRRLAAAHMDPAKLQLVRELEDRGVNRRTAQWRVMGSGTAELIQVTREMIDASSESDEVKQRVHALGLVSYLVVPLRRGRELAGAITLATAESGRRFDESDLALAAQLADRAVVANLVTNAAKYTKPGGRIEVTLERAGSAARFRVRDNGIGIADDVLPRVFDSFYQVRQSLDRARGGLGLGLAIVRSLVRAHGGDVTATSQGLGHGSEFVVTLPALQSDGDGAAASTVGNALHPRHEKLLLVDDNHDAIALLAEALTGRGFETFLAHDAPSALALAESVRPHIALLDIGLPVMDGYELGRRLHDMQPELQLVAITGYGQATDFARSKAAGFAAHLVKPIALDEVLAVLETLVAAVRTPVLHAR